MGQVNRHQQIRGTENMSNNNNNKIGRKKRKVVRTVNLVGHDSIIISLSH